MSSEQRPIQPTHSKVPEIPQELLTARTLGSYEDVPVGRDFTVYFGRREARYTDLGMGRVVDSRQHSIQRLTFHRLGEGESESDCKWRLQASDGQVGAELEGSSAYLDRDVVLGGVVKALQYLSFIPLTPKELTVTAPDGDSLSIPVTHRERLRVGPIFGVEWPWGLYQVTNSDLLKDLLK